MQSKLKAEQRYGRLVTVARTGTTGSGNVVWLCKCDCGNQIEASSGNLCKDKYATRSCGCLKREKVSISSRERCLRNHPPLLAGKRYARLVVLGLAESTKFHQRQSKVKCDCGNVVVVRNCHLVTGKTKSCGCLKREEAAKRGAKLLTTHGRSKTSAYKRAKTEKRRAQKMQATPSWGYEFARLIDAACRAAAERAHVSEQRTGRKYHIDHLVPLTGIVNGKHVVCGLHVPYNLRVIPASKNLSKGCRSWPDMP